MSSGLEIEQTIEEIRNIRLRNDLSHVIFTFPRVKDDENDGWRDPSPFLTGCLAATSESHHPQDKNLPHRVQGIT